MHITYVSFNHGSDTKLEAAAVLWNCDRIRRRAGFLHPVTAKYHHLIPMLKLANKRRNDSNHFSYSLSSFNSFLHAAINCMPHTDAFLFAVLFLLLCEFKTGRDIDGCKFFALVAQRYNTKWMTTGQEYLEAVEKPLQ